MIRKLRLAAPAAAGLLLAACATPTPPAPAVGTLEKVVVHGPSLEGALAVGYAADREVFVYLPPSYASSPKRRYPVVVSLHGFGGTGESWSARLGAPAAFDRAIAAGAREMIVVMPDASTPLVGSMYSSSVTTGDWESFIADDLVSYVDVNYRTLALRESRGLTGFSMGGYGALRIAMKRPDAFSSVYVMSACCVAPQLAAAAPPGAFAGFAELERTVTTPEQAGALGFAAAPFAMAAAWSPNPGKPPFHFDWITENGEPQADVIAAWAANAPLAMVHQHVPALRRLDAIALDVGLQDRLLAENTRLDELLEGYGIAHGFETFEGGHNDRVLERFEEKVLPFFSERLAHE